MANNLISTNHHLLNLYETLNDLQQQMNRMSRYIDELRQQEMRRAVPRTTTTSLIDSILGNRLPPISRELFDFTIPILSERGLSINTLNNATEIINFEALEEPTLCSICRDTMTSNAVCRKIKNCNHLFHIVCIDQWLERNNNCPLCRSRVTAGTGTGTGVTPSSTL